MYISLPDLHPSHLQLLLWTVSTPWQPTTSTASDRFSLRDRIVSLATPLVLVWLLKCALSFRHRINQWSVSFCLMDPTPLWQHTHRLKENKTFPDSAESPVVCKPEVNMHVDDVKVTHYLFSRHTELS